MRFAVNVDMLECQDFGPDLLVPFAVDNET
jgi:hypothetical protein